MNIESPEIIFRKIARTVLPEKIPEQGTISFQCPSNIALIKYWGKKNGQIPLNPSLSFTLKNSITITSLNWTISVSKNDPVRNYLFDGTEDESITTRVTDFISNVTEYFPFIKFLDLCFDSVNTFPHSSGIASSASAFGALALILTELERQLFEYPVTDNDSNKASFIARIGSGSACRSVIPGWSIWGETGLVTDSSDYYSVSINDRVHKTFKSFHDTIMVIDSEKKSVSSSVGHDLMNNHPFSGSRRMQAQNNLNRLLEILANGQESEFCNLVENEALTLHALMMTSDPGYLLIKPGTVEVIKRIKEFRINKGLPVCFTLDAGANVHVLYPERIEKEVERFLTDDLLKYCEKGRIIKDGIEIR